MEPTSVHEISQSKVNQNQFAIRCTEVSMYDNGNHSDASKTHAAKLILSGVTFTVGQICLMSKLDASSSSFFGTLSLGGPSFGIMTLSTLASPSIFKKSAWSWS
jgi:hypothetical protein